MSYFPTVSEELHIHIEDKKTAFAAKLLAQYLRNFFYTQRIRSLEIDCLALTVDDESHEIRRFRIKDDQILCKGKDADAYVSIDPEDSEYWRIVDQVNWLYDAPERVKNVLFTACYSAECCFGAALGINYWADALDVLNCAALQKNVVYKGIEEVDFGPDLRAYRFDSERQGFCTYDDDAAVMPCNTTWELEANATICWPGDEGEDPFDSPEIIREIIEKISPLLRKYGVGLDDYNDGDNSIELLDWLFLETKDLEAFFADFQALLDILAPYGLVIGGYSDHLISRDFGSFAAIRLGYQNYKLETAYMKV